MTSQTPDSLLTTLLWLTLIPGFLARSHVAGQPAMAGVPTSGTSWPRAAVRQARHRSDAERRTIDPRGRV